MITRQVEHAVVKIGKMGHLYGMKRPMVGKSGQYREIAQQLLPLPHHLKFLPHQLNEMPLTEFCFTFLPHLNCCIQELLLHILSLRRNRETGKQTLTYMANVDLLRDFSVKVETSFIINQQSMFFALRYISICQGYC